MSGPRQFPLQKCWNILLLVSVLKWFVVSTPHMVIIKKNNLADEFSGLEKATFLSVATILEPRLKEVGFCNQTNAQMAVERLTWQCVSLMDGESPEVVAPTEHTATADGEQEHHLWALLHSHVAAHHRVSSASASATVEIQRY